MQNPQGAASLPTWLAALIALVTGVCSGGGLIAIYAARIAKRKLPVELEEGRARTWKTGIDGTVSLADTLIEMAGALREAQSNIDELRDKSRGLEDRLSNYSRMAMENKLFWYQLKLYNLKYGPLPDAEQFPPDFDRTLLLPSVTNQ